MQTTFPRFANALALAGLVLFSTFGATRLAAKSDTASTVPAISHLASRQDAYLASLSYAAKVGGSLLTTSGTPSMEPLIHGRAFVVIQKRPYEAINMSDLLVYMGRCDQSKAHRTEMLHRTVMHDKGGWVMRGDNNRYSESWDRVTPSTYVGTVLAIFQYPQEVASARRTVRAN